MHTSYTSSLIILSLIVFTQSCTHNTLHDEAEFQHERCLKTCEHSKNLALCRTSCEAQKEKELTMKSKYEEQESADPDLVDCMAECNKNCDYVLKIFCQPCYDKCVKEAKKRVSSQGSMSLLSDIPVKEEKKTKKKSIRGFR